MRKIDYIFIESHDDMSGHHDVSNLGFHFIVNADGLITNPTDIQHPVNIIQGPIYDPDKYNRCSIFIRLCGSLKPKSLLTNPNTIYNVILVQRAALLRLLVHLRRRFEEAPILGVSELDGKELYHKNIIVSDTMNILRRELSDCP